MRFADDVGRFSERYLDLEYSASEPYSSFVDGSREQALAVSRFLLSRRLGEFSPPHGRLLLDDAGEPLGMVAFLSGPDLGRCRLQAAVALHQAGLLGDEIADRVRLAAQVLAKPHDDDLYWSRLAVADTGRGRGVGARLLEYVASEGRRLGHRRVVLEVCPAHQLPCGLYERHRFVELARHAVSDAKSGRSLAYIQMARALTYETPTFLSLTDPPAEMEAGPLARASLSAGSR